ncbi:hypothetical protein P5E93_14815 [Clostridium perfringens]|nr:hypothetical protein [Clostridium perfringens]
MNIEVTVLCTVLCTVVGAIVGVKGYQKTVQKDIEADAAQKTLLSTDIKYIRDVVNDIRIDFKELKLDFKAQDTKINNMNERLIKVEESTKSAHHRVDDLNTILKKKEML